MAARAVAALGFGLGILIGVLDAEAAPIVQSQVFVRTFVSGVGLLSDGTGQVVGTDAGPLSLSASGIGSLAAYQATAAGRVDGGVLHAFASSTGGPIGTFAVSLAAAESRFEDTFLLTSSTLPVGARVDLLFSALLSRELILEGTCGSYARADLRVDVTTHELEEGFVGDVFGEFGYFESTCRSSEGVLSGVFSAPIGGPFLVEMVLSANTEIRNSEPGTAIANVGNTVRFTATPLADFQLVTASGNSYAAATPVPEPGSLALVAIGLIGMRARRRFSDGPFCVRVDRSGSGRFRRSWSASPHRSRTTAAPSDPTR